MGDWNLEKFTCLIFESFPVFWSADRFVNAPAGGDMVNVDLRNRSSI